MSFTSDEIKFDDIRNADHPFERGARRFFGTVMLFCVLGLWITPGANWGADVLLLKTGLTSVMAICAIAAFFPRR